MGNQNSNNGGSKRRFYHPQNSQNPRSYQLYDPRRASVAQDYFTTEQYHDTKNHRINYSTSVKDLRPTYHDPPPRTPLQLFRSNKKSAQADFRRRSVATTAEYAPVTSNYETYRPQYYATPTSSTNNLRYPSTQDLEDPFTPLPAYNPYPTTPGNLYQKNPKRDQSKLLRLTTMKRNNDLRQLSSYNYPINVECVFLSTYFN